MNKKRIKEVEILGNLYILFPATLEYLINELQKKQGKYGPKAHIDHDHEEKYGDREDFLTLTYMRDETDKELETRIKRSEAAKKAKVKGDATKKANQESKARAEYERLKKLRPDWF